MYFLILGVERVGETMRDTHTYRTIYCTKCGFTHRVRLYCGDRLCRVCKEKNYFALLRRYLPLIKKTSPFRLKQITLTYRNFPYLANREVRHLVADFRQLRKTDFWRSRVRGGLAVIECKHRNDKVGWNIHIHILVDSLFISVRQLSSVWFNITKHSYIVDVRSEGNSKRSVYHLLKYFLKVPVIKGCDVEALKLDFNNAFFRSRNLITFGSLYNTEKKSAYNFVCPRCGNTEWLLDFEVFNLGLMAYPLKVGIG